MEEDAASQTLLCMQKLDHPQLVCTSLCHLLEQRSLVDVIISCGTHSMEAHKCIIAASSPYFREMFEENPKIQVVVLRSIELPTMKAIMEFIYHGQTSVREENLKYVAAAAKLFQIRGLDSLAFDVHLDDETITILPPLFSEQKPKYYKKEVPDNGSECSQANTVPAVIEEVPVKNEMNDSDIDVTEVLTALFPQQCATSTATMLPYDLACVDNQNMSDLNANEGKLYKMEDGTYVQVASVPDGMQEFVQQVEYDAAFPEYLQSFEAGETINHGDIDMQTMMLGLGLMGENAETHVSTVCEEPDASQEIDMQRHEREVMAAVLQDIDKYSMQNDYDLHQPDNANSHESFDTNFFLESQYSPLDLTDDSKLENDDGTNDSFHIYALNSISESQYSRLHMDDQSKLGDEYGR